MKNQSKAEEYSAEETAKRRDDAIRRALEMPHKLQKEMIGKSGRSSPRRRSDLTKKSKKQP